LLILYKITKEKIEWEDLYKLRHLVSVLVFSWLETSMLQH